MRILMVYPQNPDTFWSFKHVLRFVSKRSAFPPLGLLTVAAMLPRDWELKLVDLNVEPLAGRGSALGGLRHDQRHDRAPGVGARNRGAAAARCNKPIIAGGPLFTTGHEAFPRSSISCWARPRI